MTQSSRTALANRALDLVGKDTKLDIDVATDAVAKNVQRNFTPVFLRCLRKFDWPFAIKRLSLNPSGTTPVNEFSYQFDLPNDYVKLAGIDPWNIAYKMEGNSLLCNENAVTLKYVSSDCLSIPANIDPDFAEYFAHELAVALTYKMTDSVQLRKELREASKALYAEATALLSQEGTDDPLPESPWITDRYGGGDPGTTQEIRIVGLE